MQPLYGSIFAVVYSNNLISKVLTFSSLHSKPEPDHPGRDGQVQAVMWRFFVVCDFFVNFWKDGYILAFLVGYLLRGLFRSGYLWQLYYKESSMGVEWLFSMPTKWEYLFQGCFSIEYFRRGELPVFNGHSTNQRYFNSAITSTIFFKNFLTNFFFRLYFDLFRCLPIREMIFRKP